MKLLKDMNIYYDENIILVWFQFILTLLLIILIIILLNKYMIIPYAYNYFNTNFIIILDQ